MANNFIQNWRDINGVIPGPLYSPNGIQSQPQPIVIDRNPVLPGARTDYGTQNYGADTTQSIEEKIPWIRKKTTRKEMRVKNKNGVPLLEVEGVIDKPHVMIVGGKNLWRLNGGNADVNKYNAKLDSIKNELLNSKSYDDTEKILKRYANDWDLNNYILGEKENREQGFFDYSPANYFAEKIDNYNNWRNYPEAPDEYPNSEWVEDIINGLDLLRTESKKYLIGNPTLS